MNPEFDREVDSLLRRAARKDARAAGRERAGASRAAAAPPLSAHPDADELSAFAENALPQAARAHYVAHLAGCGECRRIVTGLALSAGASAEAERRAAAPAPTAGIAGWRERLAALFAPRTLRLVAPVLAVSLVGVIAYVTMRSRPDVASVTPREPASTGARTGETAATKESAGTPPAGTITTTSATNAAVTANTAGTTAATNQSQSAPAAESKKPAPATPGDVASGRAAPGADVKDAPRDTDALSDMRTAEPPAAQPAPKKEATEVTAGAVAPPPPAAAAPVVSEEKAGERRPRELEVQKRSADEDLAANSQYRNRQAEANEVNEASRRQETPDGSRGKNRSVTNYGYGGGVGSKSPPKQDAARARKRSDAPARDDGEPTSEAETRGVGGHRFRREGGKWVDVEYRPSMRMTGVRRGTDQYRALVADLPEVGRIAEQLGGEFVVVVKGRAYRVR